MARKVFDSFHYKRDSHRVSQVKNMGAVEGQPLLSANDWEKIEKGGDAAIEKWIAEQMKGKTCVVVLIGSQTAGRKWVKHEMIKGWNDGKGIVGVHIHNLKDLSQKQDTKGRNALEDVVVGTAKKKLSTVAKTYDPPYSTSTSVYSHIKNNLDAWVAEAIKIRNDFRG